MLIYFHIQFQLVMDETKDFDLNDLKDIRNNQERLFFQFSSIWDREPIDSKKKLTHLNELKLLNTILYLLISSGIIVLLILVLMGFPLIIILINIVVVISYVSYLVYSHQKCRKTLNITKKELRYFIKMKKKEKDLSVLKIIFYSILILLTIAILIITMIGIDPLISIIIIGISLVFIHFDDEFKK